jgi:predicted nucleotide-binding protein (sugar kinase/HSP70/actin superfamily)
MHCCLVTILTQNSEIMAWKSKDPNIKKMQYMKPYWLYHDIIDAYFSTHLKNLKHITLLSFQCIGIRQNISNGTPKAL